MNVGNHRFRWTIQHIAMQQADQGKGHHHVVVEPIIVNKRFHHVSINISRSGLQLSKAFWSHEQHHRQSDC